MLVNRYHDLYLLQRSCHSCRYESGDVYPCGKCSKCLGVRLFIEYAHGAPEEIHYPGTRGLQETVRKEKMKLDPDELNFLMEGLEKGNYARDTQIRGIHLLPGEKEVMGQIPEKYRNGLYNIMKQYTNGTWKLNYGQWIRD